MEVSGQRHASAALTWGEIAPGTHWIGSWVGPRAGLDDVEIRKVLLLQEIEPPVNQPVARSYIGLAIPTH
jgi:hypothetical protein